jgi:hypothetical protein
MPSRLASLSASPAIREYAQGSAQRFTNPVAEFLAPTVEVATSVGHYKKYSEKDRFHIPSTKRALGGRATQISFDVSDATYNCSPHALDFPVDHIEQLEEAQLENMLMEGSQAIAEVAALDHENSVISAALTSAGAGTAAVWNSSADPVDMIDSYILSVIKAAKYGSLMGVGVLFGASAWKIFKNHPGVRSKFIVGNGKSQNGAGYAIPTETDASALFVGNPAVRTSYMVLDTAAAGVAANIQFILDSNVLIFARSPSPTRRDPSFMKTFRLMGQWMVPGSYVREDGRAEVAKFDWSEDVQVTNSTAVARLNVSTS